MFHYRLTRPSRSATPMMRDAAQHLPRRATLIAAIPPALRAEQKATRSESARVLFAAAEVAPGRVDRERDALASSRVIFRSAAIYGVASTFHMR